MNLKVIKESKIDFNFWKKFDSLVDKSIKYSVQQNSIWLSNYIKYYLKKDQKPFIISVYKALLDSKAFVRFSFNIHPDGSVGLIQLSLQNIGTFSVNFCLMIKVVKKNRVVPTWEGFL